MSSTKRQKNDCPKCEHRFQSIKKMEEHFPTCCGVKPDNKKNKNEKKTNNVIEELNTVVTNFHNNANLIEAKSETEVFHESNNKKKSNSKNVKTVKETTTIDDSYLRYPSDEIIFKLPEEHDNNQEKLDNKNYILSKIRSAHDFLYQAENLDSDSARNDIMNFLFLRILSDKLSDKPDVGKIDLLNKEHYRKYYERANKVNEKIMLEKLEKIFSYLQDLKNLAEVENIRSITSDNDEIKEIGTIFGYHPMMQQIYTDKNFIKSEKNSTIRTLINEHILKIDIDKLYENEDVIGDIYEYFINNYNKKGSQLGQFFTPRKLMNLILEFKKNDLIEDMKNKEEYKIYDSCMGTAGWLVSSFNKLKENNNNILLSGGDVQHDTFKLGLMNLIMTQKKTPHIVKRESSLTHIDNEKYDLILTNPPFKTGLEFDIIKDNFNHDKFTTEVNNIKLDDVYKLKDDNSPIQFMELDFFKLKENGTCIIVLPYGELFFKEIKNFIKNREYLINNFEITDIMIVQGDIFNHANVKTCVFIFKKNKDTQKIRYSIINYDCTEIKLLTEITKEDLMKEPSKSLYHMNYINDNYLLKQYESVNNIQWLKFSDLFTLLEGKIQSSKVEEVDDNNDNNEDLNYLVTGAKDETWKTIKKKNESYIEGENIFISHQGNGNKRPIKYFNGNCNYSNLMSLLILDDKYKNVVKIKYYYYLFKNSQEHIENYFQKGACNQTLDTYNLNRMLIPLPLIESQSSYINENDIIDNKNMTLLVNKLFNTIKKKKNSDNKSIIIDLMTKEINRLNLLIEEIGNM